MSFPLVQPNRACPKPADFSAYYSMDLLKKQNRAVCGDFSPELPGLNSNDFMPVTQSDHSNQNQKGGSSEVRYTADGRLDETKGSGCGCQSGGDTSICKVYASNESLLVPGPALDLHAKPIGGRPVVSTQGKSSKTRKSMLDRQFDCLQPKWCESCD